MPENQSATRPKRVYFAHAVCVYGSEEEKTQLAQIHKRLRPDIVFNPAEYQNHPEKRLDSMSFCFRLIDYCHAVVFSRLLGKITSGVGKEVNYALGRGMKVYELKGTRLVPTQRPVAHASREETRLLYRVWRRSRQADDRENSQEFF